MPLLPSLQSCTFSAGMLSVLLTQLTRVWVLQHRWSKEEKGEEPSPVWTPHCSIQNYIGAHDSFLETVCREVAECAAKGAMSLRNIPRNWCATVQNWAVSCFQDLLDVASFWHQWLHHIMMFLHWMMQSMASSMLVNDVHIILKAHFTLVCCNGHALSSTDYSHDDG